MPETNRSSLLGLSVAWGYAFGGLLLAFLIAFLVPEPQGPSPWDPTAFRKAMVEMIANFRILDELADLGLVRVADVGSGVVSVDLEQIAVSNRRFGLAPFYLAIAAAALCLFARAVRLRLLAWQLGIPSTVRGQLSAFFFGRGLNLFFPFGPGEWGAIETLAEHGAPRDRAAQAVFYNRVFELLAIGVFLLAGFVYLGWGGAIEAFIWTAILIAGVVSLTRPLGRGTGARRPAGLIAHVWSALGGATLVHATAELLRKPAVFLNLLCLSLAALALEILAFWSIKQAFSSPIDAYVLMKDLDLVPFGLAVVVAALARVIPYTAAGFGVVEFVMVVMFRVFGESYLVGTTVALLSALLLNGMSFLLFLLTVWRSRCPSVLEVWRLFFARSAAEEAGESAA
jgi:hypothetical protein